MGVYTQTQNRRTSIVLSIAVGSIVSGKADTTSTFIVYVTKIVTMNHDSGAVSQLLLAVLKNLLDSLESALDTHIRDRLTSANRGA